MVVDDIVVVGAKPLFMTDYIACGKVVPARIADIVAGIARACSATGTALVGGETAEHPGLARPGRLRRRRRRGRRGRGGCRCSARDRVQDGDVVIAMASCGLHSNGFSLVRHILRRRATSATPTTRTSSAGVVGEVLLEPTRLYTDAAAESSSTSCPGAVHALSHVTGGGIAANLARVLPARLVGRARALDLVAAAGVPRARRAGRARSSRSTEGTWNLGIGMFAVVQPAAAAPSSNCSRPTASAPGSSATCRPRARDLTGFEQGAKGVDGGAVRLVGAYA